MFPMSASSMSSVLVTGGTGYVGAHVVLALAAHGYRVTVLDPCCYPQPDISEIGNKVEHVVGDEHDFYQLSEIFSTYGIDAVLHFAPDAGTSQPSGAATQHYRTKVTAALTLLEAMLSAGVNKLVFSSTGAIYGQPTHMPVAETHVQSPMHLHGASKLAVERMLSEFDSAYGLQSVICRNFNVAGADPASRVSARHCPTRQLIPLALLTALGEQPHVRVFGTDYDTVDGTCIRDYVHVSDVAQAHVLSLEYLLRGGTSDVFNLCSGRGFSVRQVVNTARQVTGQDIPMVDCDRRPGEPSVLIGDPDKARRLLHWRPQYPKLQQMIRHAWYWHQCQTSTQLSEPHTALTG